MPTHWGLVSMVSVPGGNGTHWHYAAAVTHPALCFAVEKSLCDPGRSGGPRHPPILGIIRAHGATRPGCSDARSVANSSSSTFRRHARADHHQAVHRPTFVPRGISVVDLGRGGKNKEHPLPNIVQDTHVP
jgi:hypothetical protein